MHSVLEFQFPFGRRTSLTLLSTMLLMSLCASTQAETPDTAVQETPVAEKSVENPKKRSCRKVKVTGHHIKQRVCMSNGQWRELEEEQELARIKARALSTDPTNALN